MEASELFDNCATLAARQPDGEALSRMHEVLSLTCAEGTRHQGGAFGNLFAQVDFLCKQCGMSTAEKVDVQTMRRHSNGQQPPQPQEWLYDVRSLARFVSAVFGVAVPGSLLALLPAHDRPRPRGRHVDRQCVRCIVDRWDQHYIYATTSEGPLQADYATTDHGRDLLYLRKVLREGMQLNLIDCTLTSTPQAPVPLLVPAFVVVEPDFLLDISAVAACFTPYGHHPLLYTLNRLRPRANTQAILLGNFAGTALDEAVTHDRAGLSQSLRRSFRQQALRFGACPGFDGPRFKRDALAQTRNIEEAVALLKQAHGGAQARFLLEPSFVCERLGLQGRADLMAADLSLLVEQKAGKNMKIERQSHDPHGLQKEDHYVQLLLYYGILRYNFGRTDQQVDIRLLYSRYPAAQGLLSVNYYRTLFREAIRLRNQIVATELLVAREGFGRIVPLLQPDVVYKGVRPDAYFSQYVSPALQQLAALFAALSPLERAYVERMLTFVYREQLCQKLGSASLRLQHSGGAASDLWLMPLAQKLLAGNIIMNLSIARRARTDAHGGYDLITLTPRDAAPWGALSFRRGDMVYLYAYRDQPDVRASILYKGMLEQMEPGHVTVRLNDGQQHQAVFATGGETTWAIEPGGSDLTTQASMRSLLQFAAAPPHRRTLLLGQRVPRADATRRLSRSYSPAYDDVLLRACQAQDYFLLVGPPGTGKTSQALRHLLAEACPAEPERQGCDCLLLSYTNRAVDEICAMLEADGRPYLRLGNAASCDERYRPRLLEEQLDQEATLSDLLSLVSSTPIVVGTTSTLQARQDFFELKHFGLCIVDEASQILEPGLVGLLSSEQIDRFVLVGDYKQLPAVVVQGQQDARVTEPCLLGIGLSDCRQSLFERLIRWEQRQGRTQFVGTLDHQGRMHPDVASFPCSHFYHDERLVPVPLSHQQEQALPYVAPARDALDEVLRQRRVVFIDNSVQISPQPTLNCEPTDAELLANEARIVADLLCRLRRFCGESFSSTQSVGVIVPYRSQIALIRQELDALQMPELLSVTIDTVERYQGSQRDAIVYSLAVTRRFQLDFLTANTFEEGGRLIDRKLNVAMTRARRQLVVVGCAGVLGHNRLYREFINEYSI